MHYSVDLTRAGYLRFDIILSLFFSQLIIYHLYNVELEFTIRWFSFGDLYHNYHIFQQTRNVFYEAHALKLEQVLRFSMSSLVVLNIGTYEMDFGGRPKAWALVQQKANWIFLIFFNQLARNYVEETPSVRSTSAGGPSMLSRAAVPSVPPNKASLRTAVSLPPGEPSEIMQLKKRCRHVHIIIKQSIKEEKY